MVKFVKMDIKMVKLNEIIKMSIPWAIYLTATMALFEYYTITPTTVPYGVIGWTVIVELPRVIIGWIIISKVLEAIK